jgi:putative heme-binding domain-containing protein
VKFQWSKLYDLFVTHEVHNPMKRALQVLVFCAGICPSPSHAVEPWSDEVLPVKEHLALWFDCSRQSAARGALKLPPLYSGNEVDYLLDGSGHSRHLTQLNTEARPRFRQSFRGGFLNFDGAKQALYASNLRDQFAQATVFVVANIHANKGNYACLFSLGNMAQNDYRTGLNLDLGPAGTPRVSHLNLEGNGMPGVFNLLKDAPPPFGSWHVISVGSKPGPNGSQLFLDGVAQKARDREPSSIHLGAFVLGARLYSNGAQPPFIQGFHSGDIAEFILYDRCLADTERVAVEKYLKDKYRALLERGAELSDGKSSLFAVTNAPAVQMFVPGFTVRPIPLSLPNMNNVKYRADGKLVALGYNGQIYLLSATNGSPLENHATLFWTNNSLRGPVGIALTPPGYARGEGVFVAAKGKLSLIVDTNRDDRADTEIIVADGWKELSHGVDALGVAVDHDGSVFFGLGAAAWTDPYLVDKGTDTALYDIHSERGTILKVSPDFNNRQVVCTGLRFSVALALNRQGDLFCTDQEGATWLSNGNPFDELLHIQPGRHYGFPPKHPKYLPNVIDEPSVFDYVPQHQSTCGLNFNNPVNGGPVFGPSGWADNAIVSGYSRGKLWRTELVKTAAGYVARNRQIASLNELTADACVSPQGDLVIATHSGDPDWGSGPNGSGHLYKISYTEPSAPQPTLTWCSSPSEIRIAFDRPLDYEAVRNLSKRSEITQGNYVFEGDRFEVLRPGYAAVVAQLNDIRRHITVESTALSEDRRTLILNTKPHTTAVNYSITLTGWNRSTSPAPGIVQQYPDIELATGLAGIQADWIPQAANASNPWHGWLPHVDVQIARKLTEGSAEHEAFWQAVQKTGMLELRGQLNLWEMLQPAIQPGSKLDYERVPEQVTVQFSAQTPFKIKLEKKEIGSEVGSDSRHQALLHHPSQQTWLPFTLSLSTGGKEVDLKVTWFTDADSRPRAFPLRRFFLPWAQPDGATNEIQPVAVSPEITGGNWLEGRKIFFGSTVNCQTCHTMRGEGNQVGPDLSNLIHRDYASVMKDIQQPNAAINPDFVGYHIEMKDGEHMSAVLQTENRKEITVINGNARSATISKDRIKSMKPSLVSFMPEGVLANLSTGQVKDLMTFLLTSPLEPAPLEIDGAPGPRKLAAVKELLRSDLQQNGKTPRSAPFKVVLCAGPKDHGPGEHDYPLWQKRWTTLLGLRADTQASSAQEWPSEDQWRTANVVIFYSNNPGWSEERARGLSAFLERGGGAVFVHFAVDGHDKVDSLARIIGAAWKGGVSKFRHGPLKLKFNDSPISQGITSLELTDESYWNLVGQLEGTQIIATSVEDGESRPQIWTRSHGKGRVFVCIPGHYTWTFDDPLYRLLLLRGISWAGGESAELLSDLACVGARTTNTEQRNMD